METVAKNTYEVHILPKFSENSISAEVIDDTLKIVNQMKMVIWKSLVSPSFLFLSLFLYCCVPLRIFKRSISQIFSYKLNCSIKRLLDIFGSIIALAPFSLILPIIALLIKLDSSGSIFYSQQRIGHDRRRKNRRVISADIRTERRMSDRRVENVFGKPFIIYKFRTMRKDAEIKCGPVWASENDPRITTVGKILRYTHLDELPQIYNIVKGDMSFVGPRPERPFFVNQLVKEIPDYVERLKVKPGLTGLAQLNCHYDRSIEDVKNKLYYDLLYCHDGNIASYFKIIFTTLNKKIIGK